MIIKVHRIHRLEGSERLKAFVDITINDALMIKGIKIVKSNHPDGNLLISMPSEQAKDQKWYDRIRCLNDEVKQQLTEVILKAYEEDKK